MDASRSSSDTQISFVATPLRCIRSAMSAMRVVSRAVTSTAPPVRWKRPSISVNTCS